MNLHIKSGIWYDVEVAVKVGDKVDKQLLKEEGYCDFCIDRTAGSEVIIHFDERTKNPFFRILLGIVKTLFNFLYYCFSNDSFDTPHPLDENLNFIKIVVPIDASKGGNLNLCYKAISLPNSLELNLGVLDEGETATIKYELDKREYLDGYREWQKSSLLYLTPAVAICIIGFVIAIINHYNLVAIFFIIVTAGLSFLIRRFVKEKTKQAESTFAYLESQIIKYEYKKKY